MSCLDEASTGGTTAGGGCSSCAGAGSGDTLTGLAFFKPVLWTSTPKKLVFPDNAFTGGVAVTGGSSTGEAGLVGMAFFNPDLCTSAMPKKLLPDNACTRGCGGGCDVASTTGVGVAGLPGLAFFNPVKCLSIFNQLLVLVEALVSIGAMYTGSCCPVATVGASSSSSSSNSSSKSSSSSK